MKTKKIVKTLPSKSIRHYSMTKISEDKAKEIAEEFVKENKKKKSKLDYPKILKVKFRSERDCNKFAILIQQTIDYSKKQIEFKIPTWRNHGKWKFKGIPKIKVINKGLKSEHAEHWIGMPEFEQENKDWIYHQIQLEFKDAISYSHFANLVKQHLKISTPSIYFPKWTPSKNTKNFKWISSLPKDKITPRYPIFIVSKGRSYSRLTSKTLEEMGVPYFIVIEPSEIEEYAAVIDINKILVLPNNTDPKNPTGPGYARNCCRDHAWANGYERHWVLDDNIDGFFRLHNNRRYRVGDGAIFRAAEDFVDRYENIWVAGFQYRFFAAQKSKFPPFVANTRIYSCLLIDNRRVLNVNGELTLWRERYNEDTILSLDVLENNYCTIQFNAFLQGKVGTQTLKGGNTEVFYAVEGKDGNIEIIEGDYNPLGTVKKSLNLLELYPEVTKIVKRYGRVHHDVDYKKYRSNKLVLKKGLKITQSSNNYGMELQYFGAPENLKKQKKNNEKKD